MSEKWDIDLFARFYNGLVTRRYAGSGKHVNIPGVSFLLRILLVYVDEDGDDRVSSSISSIARLTEIEGASCSDRGGLGKTSTDDSSSELLDSSLSANILSIRTEKRDS